MIVHILILYLYMLTVRSQFPIVKGTIPYYAGKDVLSSKTSGDYFGSAVCEIKDINGDGFDDLIVGAKGYSIGGAIFVYFLDSEGVPLEEHIITDPAIPLSENDMFGHSVTTISDLDSDGLDEIVVGASQDDEGNTISPYNGNDIYQDFGAIYVVSIDEEANLKWFTKIWETDTALAYYDYFGNSVDSLGDLNNDGVPDLVVGRVGYDQPNFNGGAIEIVFLDISGNIQDSMLIAENTNGMGTTSKSFGSSVARINDLDGDDINDIAVGCTGHDDGDTDNGAVYILFMNANGTVKSNTIISQSSLHSISLGYKYHFGSSVRMIPDLNGDNIDDLIVGAPSCDVGGTNRGCAYFLLLNNDGSVLNDTEVSNSLMNSVNADENSWLIDNVEFGSSITATRDFNGDYIADAIISSVKFWDSENKASGGYHILLLEGTSTNPCFDDPCQNAAPCAAIDNIKYTCDCTGTGYEGENCEIDINECQSNPCQNGGDCLDTGVYSYICDCAFVDYEGDNCDTWINDCISHTCQNGATCNDLTRDFSCTCASGWAGDECQTNIDECSSDPCLNGGTCFDHVAEYACLCVDGWTGDNCESNINDCASNPCKNGGTCSDGVASYTCSCATGFTGDDCETNIDDCASNPCENFATCNDGIANYTCSCVNGYSGDNCETNIDDCASDPCENGSTCSDYTADYFCSCVNGWTGTNCETDIDDCASDPCKNGGTCSDGIAIIVVHV